MKKFFSAFTTVILSWAFLGLLTFAQDMPDQSDVDPGSAHSGPMNRETGEMPCGMGCGMGWGMPWGMDHGMGYGPKGIGMGPVTLELCHAGCPEFLLWSARRLDLTADQVKSLESLNAEFMRYAIKKKADLAIGMLDLGTALNQSTPDLNAVEKQITAINQMEVDIQLTLLTTVRKARAILNADQLKKLEELKPEFRRMEGHMPMEQRRPMERGRMRPGAGAPGGPGQ